VDDVIQLWRNINSTETVTYDTIPDIYQNDESYVVTEKYQDGMNANEVWLYKVIGGGHDWPGASGNMDINASELAWEFFNQFSLSYVIGDVDYDDQINISDLLLISDGIILEIDYDFLFDHNNDDQLDMNDIFSIIASIFGIG
jgi:hypothetical protein